MSSRNRTSSNNNAQATSGNNNTGRSGKADGKQPQQPAPTRGLQFSRGHGTVQILNHLDKRAITPSSSFQFKWTKEALAMTLNWNIIDRMPRPNTNAAPKLMKTVFQGFTDKHVQDCWGSFPGSLIILWRRRSPQRPWPCPRTRTSIPCAGRACLGPPPDLQYDRSRRGACGVQPGIGALTKP